MLISTGIQAWESGEQPDPDQRSRITYVRGDVVIQPSVSGNTLEAVINMPFMKGDRLATGSDGVLEFRLGDGVTGWSWYETKIELTESMMLTTDERRTHIKLWYGAVAVRSYPLSHLVHRASVNMGVSQLDLDADSLVRITIESDQTAVYVTAVKGGATIDPEGARHRVAQGETWRSPYGSNDWNSFRPLGEDAFDTWYLEREQLVTDAYEYADQIPAGAVPAEYADQVAGLHGYGRWIYVDQGWYWMPYVASGWVPYHTGFWDYVSPWGWIWIPFEPWGWTAYHYGYWRFFAGRGWMWFPSWYWRGHYAHWRYNPGRSVHWIAAHPDDDMDSHGILRPGAVPLNSRLAIGIPVEAAQTIDQMVNRIPVQRNAVRSLPAGHSDWISTVPDTLKPSMSRRQNSDHTIDESATRIHRYGGNRPASREISPYGGRPYIQPRQHIEEQGGIPYRPRRPGLQTPRSPEGYNGQPQAIPGNSSPQPQRQEKRNVPQESKPRLKKPGHASPSGTTPGTGDGIQAGNVSAVFSKAPPVSGNIILNLLKTGLSMGVKGKTAGRLAPNSTVSKSLSSK